MTSPRPLVVRCGAFGDMVIALSLIAALSRRYGVPVDVLTSGSWSRGLLEGQPGVGEVYVVGSRRTPYLLAPQQRQIVEALRASGPRPAWVCDTGPWAPRLLSRAGLTRDHVLLASSACPILPREHRVDRWLRFANLAPSAFPADALDAITLARYRAPPLTVLPAWRREVEDWVVSRGLAERRLVLVQAGNKRTMRWWAPRGRETNTKDWPVARWAEVIRYVLEEHAETHVVLLGVPAEASVNEEIRRAAGSSRIYNAAPELPVSRLLALQSIATGMISVDTGPAHSAGALGCPLVVLFGDAKIDRYAPRSPNGLVEVLQGPADAPRRIEAITAQQVISAWKALDRPCVPSFVSTQ
ncbi:MAG TPA: glycosyltransferase family 9 protein [Steroidobacteraceae bacterium]|nr:glycosyltransferase family 9 protein [Steroidobacteraceae bacterium]